MTMNTDRFLSGLNVTYNMCIPVPRFLNKFLRYVT